MMNLYERLISQKKDGTVSQVSVTVSQVSVTVSQVSVTVSQCHG